MTDVRKTFRCDGCGASIAGPEWCDPSYIVHTFDCPQNPYQEHNLEQRNLLTDRIQKAATK